MYRAASGRREPVHRDAWAFAGTTYGEGSSSGGGGGGGGGGAGGHGGGGGPPCTVSREVIITEPRPLPAKAGALTLREQRLEQVEHLEATCERTMRLAVLNELTFEPSPDLAPFLDATYVTLEESGANNSIYTMHYRRLARSGELARVGYSNECTRSGITRYTLRVHVAGAPSDPPAETLDVAQDCPSEEGCAVQTSNENDPVWLALLVAPAAWVARRRHRRR